MKLDAQAKELAEFNRQTATSARSQSGLRSSQRGKVASSLTTGNGATGLRKGKEKDWAIGTRISARLRGSARDDNEEWQAVPQEWLAGEDRAKMSNGGGRKEEEDWLHDVAVKTGLEREGSEISDLTELSEDNESVMENGDGRGKGQEYEAINQEDEDEEGHLVQDIKQEETQGMNPRDDRGAEEPTVLPEGFIEWETVSFRHEYKTSALLLGLCRYVLPCMNGSTSRSASQEQHITSKRICIRSLPMKLYQRSLKNFEWVSHLFILITIKYL